MDGFQEEVFSACEKSRDSIMLTAMTSRPPPIAAVAGKKESFADILARFNSF